MAPDDGRSGAAWPLAGGEPTARGLIRSRPGDFRVVERMAVRPAGEGEHLWVRVRKTGLNTADVSAWLAERAGLPRRAVSFAGLKDRHAVTEQWFSLHLPGRPDPGLRQPPEGIEVLETVRHRRKLNRGTHSGNEFELVVRRLHGDLDALTTRLDRVIEQGVPNYFGEQRFGHGGANWERASDWLAGPGEAPRKRSLRGLWLSAARSGLFNQVLAARVGKDCWNRVLPGDLLQPEGSRGLFREEDEPRADERVRTGEVHPTAPLPGVPGMASSRAAEALEQEALAPFAEVVEGLCREGVDASRRATRLLVTDLRWAVREDRLWLTFGLPAGAFATTVLRELITTENASRTAAD